MEPQDLQLFVAPSVIFIQNFASTEHALPERLVEVLRACNAYYPQFVGSVVRFRSETRYG